MNASEGGRETEERGGAGAEIAVFPMSRVMKRPRNDQSEILEKVLEQVRRNLDAEVNRKLADFEGERSEISLGRVMARMRRSRERGAWLMRSLRALSAFGATVWNSRAVRMLVP